MIEYDFTLNYEQQQVLIYWCAFFVCLLPFYIERLLSSSKKVSEAQGLNSKVNDAVLNDDYLDGVIIVEQQTNEDFKGDKIGNGTMDWDIENNDKVIKVNSGLLEELLNDK